MTASECFDTVVAAAVLEHLSDVEIRDLFVRLDSVTRVGSRLIFTHPSPAVDVVLWVLQALRLIDGQDIEAHDGRQLDDALPILASLGWHLTDRKSFEFGLNTVVELVRSDVS